MADQDPLTQVYTAIWTMLEARADFAALVPAGSRIKYGGEKPYHNLDHQTEAEDIQVRVFCGEILPNLENTSSSSALDTVWTIEIRTNDQRMLKLFRTVFAVCRAMLKWDTHLKTNLTWNSTTFVWDATPGKVTCKLGMPDQDVRGWVAAWVGTARMEFQTSALEA